MNSNMSENAVEKTYWFQSLSAKFYSGLAFFVTSILIISIFSWRSLLEVVNVQKVLVTENIPELMLSASIVRESEKLISSAPQLINSISEKELDSVRDNLKKDINVLKKFLNDLKQSQFSKKYFKIYDLVDKMTDNLNSIEISVSKKRELLSGIQKISDQITDLSREIHTLLVTEVDDRTFDLAIKSKLLHL